MRSIKINEAIKYYLTGCEKNNYGSLKYMGDFYFHNHETEIALNYYLRCCQVKITDDLDFLAKTRDLLCQSSKKSKYINTTIMLCKYYIFYMSVKDINQDININYVKLSITLTAIMYCSYEKAYFTTHYKKFDISDMINPSMSFIETIARLNFILD